METGRLTIDVEASNNTVAIQPERIVVQAKALYVPGNEYHERCNLMREIICQQILSRSFDVNHDRFHVYRALFSFPNRSCFFLLDHGHAVDDDVPISWYKWNGTSMIRQQSLPSELLKKVREYPFDKRAGPALVFCKEVTPETRRNIIRERFRMNMKIPDNEVKYLNDNPEVVQWLLNNVNSTLRPKIKSLCSPESYTDIEKGVEDVSQ